MRTRLSTLLTLFYKIGMLSIFAFFGFILIAGSMGYEWKKPGRTSVPTSTSARVLYAMASLGSLYCVWQCARLKRVEIDDNSLYVSNYRTEIQVPLADIVDVSETSRYWFAIAINFRGDSPFGRSIVFRPRHRFYWSGLHPVARQISKLAEQARLEAASCGQKDASSKQPATAKRPDITA